jgi:hypothetical protein
LAAKAGILGLSNDLKEKVDVSAFRIDAGCSRLQLQHLGALELSEKKWVLSVQLPGVSRHSRHVLEACGDGLASFVERNCRVTLAPIG